MKAEEKLQEYYDSTGFSGNDKLGDRWVKVYAGPFYLRIRNTEKRSISYDITTSTT